ncbi:MAG: histidine phosphatase family protein [Bacteroidaceae bacterium]|nr:histidine phosphatase family protein [Bacteroidaceae bacterium]
MEKLATTLYIVRHGETEENKQHILQGHLPGHLTENGIEQIRQLRDQLSSIPFDAIVCSDLKRCVDTANILNEPHKLRILTTKLLRERDWGDYTGVSIASVDRSKPFPKNVESEAAMKKRAGIFLDFVRKTYPGKTVLSVGHGLFNRYIQASFYGKTIQEIQIMSNAEFRMLEL